MISYNCHRQSSETLSLPLRWKLAILNNFVNFLDSQQNYKIIHSGGPLNRASEIVNESMTPAHFIVFIHYARDVGDVVVKFSLLFLHCHYNMGCHT